MRLKDLSSICVVSVFISESVFSCWWRICVCVCFCFLRRLISFKNTQALIPTHGYLRSSSCLELAHIPGHRRTWSCRECLRTSVHIHHCLAWHTHPPLKEKTRTSEHIVHTCSQGMFLEKKKKETQWTFLLAATPDIKQLISDADNQNASLNFVGTHL